MEVREDTNAESRSGATGQCTKAGQVVDLIATLMGQRTAFKTELPHLAGQGDYQTELLKSNAAAA
jgi:hypothetical protein